MAIGSYDMTFDSKSSDTESASKSVKKPWSTPELSVFGKVTSVTEQYISDRNVKTAFAPVSPKEALVRLTSLPLETWAYKHEDTSVRHMGPMAQDFATAFELGDDDTRIYALDGIGVAFAAIQGLDSFRREQAAEIGRLQGEIALLRAELEALRTSQPGPNAAHNKARN
jgi:hypothetical protein